VSGVGYYTTKVTLPSEWSKNHGAVLTIESTNGNSSAVYVNGRKAPAYDFNKHAVDISELLVGGENTIQVEVSSTLTNRLIAKKYYEDKANPTSMLGSEIAGMDEEAMMENMSSLFAGFPKATVQDYGMTGEVKLVTYVVVEI
ncbi:MAG: cell wall anchor protein, partial [Herbinix sp.]|nr:cell wall anchor protein [Herbinix sp.]